MTQGKVKTMLEIREVIHRLREGHSNRQIHRETSIDRSLVQKIRTVSFARGWLSPLAQMPTDEQIFLAWGNRESRQKQHYLDPYKEKLKQWKNQGISAAVMSLLLKDECHCDPQAIRRYLRKHFPKQIDRVMVRHTEPGKDVDIDFGYLGTFLDSQGTLRKTWVFSFRLRHSRRAYREVVLDQKADTFLMAHIRAFEWFGGVPKNVILDNCKAAIIQCTADNDGVRRSYQELAEHYGFVIAPCLPRTPQHKGGVEGDIKYIKTNFLPYFKERQNNNLSTIEELKKALEEWGNRVADTHLVHGVDRSPLELFFSEEKNALRLLPTNRWELTKWNQCSVRRDWRIMYECAYYSVPYNLIGQTVQVCATTDTVRIFHNHKEVAYHVRAKEKWAYRRKAEHAPPLEEGVLTCTKEGLLSLAEKIGPNTYEVAKEILAHPTIDKLRPARRLINLANTYTGERLEKACSRATHYKLFSYTSVKNILENSLDKELEEVMTTPVEKIIPLYRFARNPAAYKSRETFTDKLERLHPCSKHGNAMMRVYDSILADSIIEEEKK